MSNSFEYSLTKIVSNPANQLVVALSLATSPNTFISSQVIPPPYDGGTAVVNFNYDNLTAMYVITVIESANGTTTGIISISIMFIPKFISGSATIIGPLNHSTNGVNYLTYKLVVNYNNTITRGVDGA